MEIKKKIKKESINNSIDAIFNKMKQDSNNPQQKGKSQKLNNEKQSTPKEPQIKKQKKQTQKRKEDQTQNKKLKVKNQTEEGYKIYNTEELNIGKGGGTKLCPFDCDCCF